MTSPLWMTTRQVAEESGRHRDNVIDALNDKLLTGVQRCPGARWRVSRKAFEAWMEKGAPVDTPAAARVRRAS
jgi:excisionase family DNA binding protein